MSFPRPFPSAFGASDAPDEPGTRFAGLATRVGPPWLRRGMSGLVMAALLAPLDLLRLRMDESVKARFPRWTQPDALALIGRERRIRRGPTEPSDIYASRLLRWLDDHRDRGGAYALLRQLRAYWRGTHDGLLEVVTHRGVRHSSSGATIARDVITWTADGTDAWAQVWVFLFALTDPRPVDAARYELITREWTAAHVARTHLVVLWGFGRLWDYPLPVDTWDEWETGLTWEAWDDQSPLVLSHTEE